MEEEEYSSFKFQDSDRFFEVESYSTIHSKPTSYNKLCKYEYRNLNYKSPLSNKTLPFNSRNLSTHSNFVVFDD